MRRRLCLIAAMAIAVCVAGCSPNWLSLQLDFYNQSGVYLHSVEVVRAVQLVPIPAAATYFNIKFSSREQSGERLPFNYLLTGVDNGDGFSYPLAHGHMGETDDEVIVQKLLRDSTGEPMVSEFQAVLEADFTLRNSDSWSTMTLWKEFASFKAVPEEYITDENKENKNDDRPETETEEVTQ